MSQLAAVFTATAEDQNCAKRQLPLVAEQLLPEKSIINRRPQIYRLFQTFTNTYAPMGKLRKIFDEALSQEDIIGLSIGTRPDCLDPMLSSY